MGLDTRRLFAIRVEETPASAMESTRVLKLGSGVPAVDGTPFAPSESLASPQCRAG